MILGEIDFVSQIISNCHPLQNEMKTYNYSEAATTSDCSIDISLVCDIPFENIHCFQAFVAPIKSVKRSLLCKGRNITHVCVCMYHQ